MQTIKKFIKNNLGHFAPLTSAFFLGGVLFVQAGGSSFTYGVFMTLIGNNAQPPSTAISYTTQIQTPAITVASTTVASNLKAGPLVLEVAALTPTGTSSPSNEYATTTTGRNSLQISWPSVPNATGYAIYVGTTTPGTEQSYFMATTTGGVPNTFYTLNSTSSPTYYPIPGQGSGYLTSQNSATTSIDTSGLIRSVSSATTTCAASLNGSIFYNLSNKHLWICNTAGPTWTLII